MIPSWAVAEAMRRAEQRRAAAEARAEAMTRWFSRLLWRRAGKRITRHGRKRVV